MNGSRTEELLQSLFDGEIAEADFHELEEALALDPKLRALYKEYAVLHSDLEARGELASVDKAGQGTSEILRIQRRRYLGWSIGLAAAAVAVIAFALTFVRMAPSDYHVQYRVSPDSRFVAIFPEGASEADGLVEGTVLELDQGFVELTFESGVRAVVSAPANLSVTSESSLDLHE